MRTNRVVVATGVPTVAVQVAHPALLAEELVPRADRADPGEGPATSSDDARAVVRDCREPPHVVRWVDDDRLLVSGADAASVPPRLRDKTIVQRTGQLMYELSTIYPEISGIMPAYGWEAPYALTAEGVPYIGAASQLPAPSVRVRRRQPQRDRRLSRQPHPAPPASRRDGYRPTRRSGSTGEHR